MTTTNAAVVAAWHSATTAFLAVVVTADLSGPDGATVAVEYVGTTPLYDGQGLLKPLAQIKAECVASAKAQRDAQKAGTAALALSGSVTL